MKRYPVHLIAKPTLLDDITHDNGNTEDIISTIVNVGDKYCADFTKKFAPHLKGKTVLITCGNVHEFVKTQIPYVLDPRGVQFIKSPGRLWQDKAGDCKSFSVFTASILKNLGIEYGYRFVSYKADDATPTHVYVYVPNPGGEIIIDAVWSGPFNTQKKYAHKKDILMPQISYLGATGDESHIAGELNIPEEHYERMTEGELTLRLARQKLEIDRQNAESLGGFWKSPGYDRSLKLVNHMLRNVDRPEVITAIGEHFEQHSDAHIAGLGKFVKKVGKGIAKGVKAVAKTTAKVATLVPRLAIKGVMEVYLPKAAPMFLYLFTAPGINLPDKMRRKKEKAEKFKRFVCGKIGMKEAHFMSVIRNSLTKKYRQSPESYLSAKLKSAGISGIGATRRRQVVNRQRSLNVSLGPGATAMTAMAPQSIPPSVLQRVNSLPVTAAAKPGGGGLMNAVNSAAQGNIIGAVISAISWIIQKLGGSKDDKLEADDMPDVEADAGNAFQYKDLQQDYSNLNGEQRMEVKDVASNLIDRNASPEDTRQTLNQVSYLNDGQRQEISNEVAEGYEPLTDGEASSLASQVKQGGNLDPYLNGGGSGALCKC